MIGSDTAKKRYFIAHKFPGMIAKRTVTGNAPVFLIGFYFNDHIGNTVFIKM